MRPSNVVTSDRRNGGARPGPHRAVRGGPLLGKLAILALFVVGVTAFFYFDLGQYLSLAALKANKDALRAYTEAHYAATVGSYIVIYCAQTALSLPGAAILTLTGGFLFGTLWGTVYVNLAATSGAALAFLAARYLLRDAVERKFGPRLASIQRGFAQNAFNYLLTLRLIPLFPFFLVNLASGLTRVRLSTYVAATAVGILPGSAVYANAGSQLGAIESLKDVVSPGVLGAFALLGGLALVPVIYQKLRRPSPVR
ncbi:MAG: TVP38/TMEM64 family protein [Nitrospirota bacterium]